MGVLDHVARRLEQIGLRLQRTDGADARPGVLQGRAGRWDVDIVEADDLSSDIRSVIAIQNEGRAPIVVGDRIDGRRAEALRTAGIAFADAEGNAWLAFDGMHVDIRGRRSPRSVTEPSARPQMNLFSAKRARVSFALLAWPELAAAPIRHLAAAAGVSTGLAQTTITALDERGYLRRGVPSLRRGGELLDAWAAAYPLGLGRALTLGDFVGDPSFDIQRLGPDAQIGGESAVPGLVRSESVTVYVPTFDKKAAFALRWRTDGPANIHIREKFWVSPDERITDTGAGREVPPVLTYADLLAVQDSRLTEAAHELRATDDRLRTL